MKFERTIYPSTFPLSLPYDTPHVVEMIGRVANAMGGGREQHVAYVRTREQTRREILQLRPRFM